MDRDFERSYLQAKATADIPNLFRRFNADPHRGNYELYCREFSYCTIFGNLRTSNLQSILSLLEITKLPNIMFLIQLDDYHGMYSPWPEFSFYPYKSAVVQAIQAKLKKMKIDGVVSRFLGHRTIGAFLHIDGKTVGDGETRKLVKALAADIVEYVFEKTSESVSIGIGDFCDSHAQFPRAYSECKTALSYAFYSGKRAVEIFDGENCKKAYVRQDITQAYFTNIITRLDKCDAASCRPIADEMADRLKKSETPHLTARLLVARLFGRITDYYADAGLDQDALLTVAKDSVVELFNCNFLTQFADIVAAFCEKIGELYNGARQSPDERFRRHVSDCIERHSSDCLFGLGAIAALSNYSPSYFSRLFARTYGEPFSRYLASYRVERAKKLLMQESMTLQEVARKAGFCSTSYFCSVFRKKTGKSPRQYAGETLIKQKDVKRVLVPG